MGEIVLNKDLVIKVLSSSKTISEAVEKIYGEKLRKYSKRITDFCIRNNIDYNSLLIPKEEKHYYCQYCGEEILGKDRSRKQYCNHSCAASATNKGKTQSEETKNKISRTLQARDKNFNGVYREKGIKKIKPKKEKNKQTYKTYQCINCGKEFTSMVKGIPYKYCCHQCQVAYQYNEYIKRWKNGEETGVNGKYDMSERVRRYMLEKVGHQCERCGWHEVNPATGRIPLQVHHIDGDCTNNTEKNLQVLCPNCHSLTENYGSRNKNATAGRTEYYTSKYRKIRNEGLKDANS